MEKLWKSSGIFICICFLVLSSLFISGCTNQQPAVPGSQLQEKAGSVTVVATTHVSASTIDVVSTGSGPGNNGKGDKISLSGSTTILPVAAKAAEVYMASHPDWDISVSGGGSGAGVTATGSGTVDIGMSSRDLKKEEIAKYPSLTTITIAKDGIVLIVNPGNQVESLSLSDVMNIFSGNYTNWKQVGGADSPIVIIGRDSASGTRDFFNTAVMKGMNSSNTMLEKNSNGAIQQTVARTPGAIGYVGLGYVDSTVKPLSINMNGTISVASVDSIKALTYPLSRNLYLITKGQPAGNIKIFIDYLLSPEGQKLVAEEDFVPV